MAPVLNFSRLTTVWRAYNTHVLPNRRGRAEQKNPFTTYVYEKVSRAEHMLAFPIAKSEQ